MIEEQKATLQELAHISGLQVRPLLGNGYASRALLRSAQGRLFDESGAFIPGSAIHEVGGAAMGLDPKTSVVNRFNQCWDVPNVLVVDGACFVSTGCQGPALTIMALAARACNHIAKEFKAGAV